MTHVLSRVEREELWREILSFGKYIISLFSTSRKAGTVSPKLCMNQASVVQSFVTLVVTLRRRRYGMPGLKMIKPCTWVVETLLLWE
jgi:hypothetical protein